MRNNAKIDCFPVIMLTSQSLLTSAFVTFPNVLQCNTITNDKITQQIHIIYMLKKYCIFMIWRHSGNLRRVFSKMTPRHTCSEFWRRPNNMKTSNETLWRTFHLSYQMKLCHGLCTPSEGLFVTWRSFPLVWPGPAHHTEQTPFSLQPPINHLLVRLLTSPV